jgi:hypothetical protein
VQLRADGYTYEAIREALAEFGVEVSESTLRREVRKHQKRLFRAIGGMQPSAPKPDVLGPPGPQRQSFAHPPSIHATGRQIAEAYFDAHPSNSLLPSEETP